MDVSDAAAVEAVIDDVVATLGGLDFRTQRELAVMTRMGTGVIVNTSSAPSQASFRRQRCSVSS